MTETRLPSSVRDRSSVVLSSAGDPDDALAACRRFQRRLLTLGIGNQLAVDVHALESGRWGVFLTTVTNDS